LVSADFLGPDQVCGSHCFAGQAAPLAGVAVQPLEEIIQAVCQSAYRCTRCSFRTGLSSIVKPTVGGVSGGFETACNTETTGTPMSHFFLEK
jgi:hypothetical protein